MRPLSKRYLLGLLLAIAAHNNVDRTALGIMLQSIEVELRLTDTQLGLLTGIAFSLFYSVLGIPIARWADRGNRIHILTLTTALWSGAVAFCGAAAGFVELLILRVLVGVGEAGCFPTSHSLIADRFSRAERPKATATFLVGPPLGMLIGYLGAGWLNEFYGWRKTFVLLGVPGFALATLAYLTLREPRHEFTSQSLLTRRVGLREAVTTLWARRSYRHLLMSLSVTGFFSYGILLWLPAFFMREYGLQTGEAGTWFACVSGLGGILGTYWGGVWASRHAHENEHLQLRVVAVAFILLGVASAGVYLLPNAYLGFISLGVAMTGGCAMNGPIYAAIQSIVPDRLRATAVATIYLIANLVGLGLGPLAVGALSDYLRPAMHEHSLRYALLSFCPGYFWAGWHVWQGSRAVTRDIAENAIRQ